MYNNSKYLTELPLLLMPVLGLTTLQAWCMFAILGILFAALLEANWFHDFKGAMITFWVLIFFFI